MHAAVVSALLQIQALPDSSTTNDGGCPRTAPRLSDGKIRRAIQQGYNLNKLVVCNPHGQASHRFGDGGIKSVTSQIHPPKVTSSQLANTLLNSSKIDDSVEQCPPFTTHHIPSPEHYRNALHFFYKRVDLTRRLYEPLPFSTCESTRVL
ncbi:Large ribosomal subunit protein [Trichinella pseudospiralis]